MTLAQPADTSRTPTGVLALRESTCSPLGADLTFTSAVVIPMTRAYASEEQARLATNKIPLNARLLAVTRFDPKKHNDQAQPRASRVAGWPSAGALCYASYRTPIFPRLVEKAKRLRVAWPTRPAETTPQTDAAYGLCWCTRFGSPARQQHSVSTCVHPALVYVALAVPRTYPPKAFFARKCIVRLCVPSFDIGDTSVCSCSKLSGSFRRRFTSLTISRWLPSHALRQWKPLRCLRPFGPVAPPPLVAFLQHRPFPLLFFPPLLFEWQQFSSLELRELQPILEIHYPFSLSESLCQIPY